MSLKNGIYQLRFVPAGGEPAPGMLAATGEGLGNTVRILANSPPNFEKQSVSIVHDVDILISLTKFAITQWKVTHAQGDSYHIAWTMSFGPPFFMSLDGPNGPIMQDTPVMLLSNKQEWVITKGEGENVYRWVSFGSSFPVRRYLQRPTIISISVADQLVGVNMAIDKVDNDEVRSRCLCRCLDLILMGG